MTEEDKILYLNSRRDGKTGHHLLGENGLYTVLDAQRRSRMEKLYKPIEEFAWRPASDEEIEKNTVPSLQLLGEAQKKAKSNMDKIGNVDEFVEWIKGE